MPLITLQTSTTLSHFTSRQLASALTQLTATVLGKKLPLTAVAVLPTASDWVIGDEPLPADQCTVAVEIRITAGTNTEAEKARWIEGVWAMLHAHLPQPPALASYVSVVELPATNWGYGGQTQAARAG